MTRQDGSAYPPAPFDGDRYDVLKTLLRLEADYDWSVEAAEQDPGGHLDVTQPLPAIHRHQLCGHDCTWGNCSGLEGICVSCEFRLQDDREVHRSRGMNVK